MIEKNKNLIIKLSFIPIIIIVIVSIITYYNGKSKRIKDIKLESETLTISIGESKEISYTIDPITAKDSPLVWTTDNENVLDVHHGQVNGKAIGDATIWVSSKDNPSIKKTIYVRVQTKMNNFKQRMINTFKYSLINNDVLEIKGQNKIIFSTNVFEAVYNPFTYRYYYGQKVIYVYDPNNQVIFRYSIADNYHECGLGAEWCNTNTQAVLQNIEMMKRLFTSYLGTEYTIEDILQ